MKKFIVLLSLFVCTTVFAHTITWHDGNTSTQTTCTDGDNVTPPTPIGKYGYHFKEWGKITRIEYLESTGTQHIDTEYIPNQKSVVYLRIAATVAGKMHTGMHDSLCNGQKARFKVDNNSVGLGGWARFNYTTYQIYDIVWDNALTAVYVNNSLLTDIAEPLIQYTCNRRSFYLGGVIGGTGTIEHGNNRVYGFQATEQGVLIRDMIPVLDYNNVPCMYDKVEGKFYYNSGTGSFIAGPVVN